MLTPVKMQRIRNIKPEFFQHEKLFELEQNSKLPVRLAFIGLWTCCDREGRFDWRPRRLKNAILPYDEIDFAAVLDALAGGGFIKKYTVGEDDFGLVPTFKKHQHIGTKEKQTRTGFPPPPDVNRYESGSAQVQEPDGALGLGLGKGVGLGVGKNSAEAESESPHSPSEKKPNKNDADVLADKLWPLMQQRVRAVGIDTGSPIRRFEVDGKIMTKAQFVELRDGSLSDTIAFRVLEYASAPAIVEYLLEQIGGWPRIKLAMDNMREADFIRRDFDKRVRNALAQGVSGEIGSFPDPFIRACTLQRDGANWLKAAEEQATEA